MKYTFRTILLTLLVLARAVAFGAPQATPGTGLETTSTTPLRVVVEEISDNAKQLGLSTELIEASISQALRKAGITPADSKDFAASEGNLYVRVSVSGASSSKSFSKKWNMCAFRSV